MLHILFTAIAPLLLLQGIVLEQEVYGNLLSVPNLAECVEHYDLDIELSKETALINNKLELRVPENQEHIDIYIPHIAFNNGMKEGAFRNDGSALYRSNDFKQLSWKINGHELNSGFSLTVHDSLVKLKNRYLELEKVQESYKKTIAKIYADHDVSVDSNNIATYPSTDAMKRVHHALDTLKVWKTSYDFHDFKMSNEFQNKVVSGDYPWYILKIKNDFNPAEIFTFELSYELELGPSVTNKGKNYFHFMFHSLEQKMETPVNVTMDIKNLPFRKIKSQLPEEFIYETENKTVSGTIDPEKTGKLLLLF